MRGAKASLAAGVPGAAKGKIAVTSQFLTAPPGGDVFDASAGVTLQVASGDGANSLVAWSAADCSTATTGRIRCRSVDGTAIATFRPDASGGWKMTTVIGQLELAAPLSGPIFVRVQHGAGIDRTAVLLSCTGSPTKVRCTLP